MLVLIILFAILKMVEATVAEYFVLIAGVGLFLGGLYNTFSSLVTMELVKVIEPAFRTKYLVLYTSVLMCVANITTASFQIIIGIKMNKGTHAPMQMNPSSSASSSGLE
jgi:membrane-bound ClpP family serine protease